MPRRTTFVLLQLRIRLMNAARDCCSKILLTSVCISIFEYSWHLVFYKLRSNFSARLWTAERRRERWLTQSVNLSFLLPILVDGLIMYCLPDQVSVFTLTIHLGVWLVSKRMFILNFNILSEGKLRKNGVHFIFIQPAGNNYVCRILYSSACCCCKASYTWLIFNIFLKLNVRM